MQVLNLDQEVLEKLKTQVSIQPIQVSESGKEEASHTEILFAMGVISGIFMYIFIVMYGAQIMSGVIEEKSGKVMEIMISSVRPFQLMLGKVIGLASVGLFQFLIWMVLALVLTTAVLGYFGLPLFQQEMMGELNGNQELLQGFQENQWFSIWETIPAGQMAICFLVYFLGGYLMYGALFAAVGSAVDNPSEAQQFMLPLTFPLLISYLGLFSFILDEPHSPLSFWLSIIPFTAPVAMMGRLAFSVPTWEIILSIALLVGGFIFTIWVASRIYRIGILMHGAKVNYRLLFKWFKMKG